jgi:Arc/MetJ family transcription regulator
LRYPSYGNLGIREESMAKTSVEIDPEHLQRARAILGTETLRETIDAALRQVIRAAAVDNLVELAEEGAFDALLEPDAEERMWG